MDQSYKFLLWLHDNILYAEHTDLLCHLNNVNFGIIYKKFYIKKNLSSSRTSIIIYGQSMGYVITSA